MSSDTQLSMEELPQPGRLRFAARRWMRFIVPLTGTVVFGWLAFRFDASGTAADLNSLSDRLLFVAPFLVCFALTLFFAHWCALAIRDNEPRWAATIANFGMAGLPERRKIWGLRAYLSYSGYIVSVVLTLNTKVAILWPSHAKLVSEMAYVVSVIFLFLVLGAFSGSGKGPASSSSAQ